MNDHPHLWKTLVYFNNKTSEFSLYPQKGFIEITNIKTILMDTNKHYKTLAFCEKTKIYLQIEEVTIAYFALLLRLIKKVGLMLKHLNLKILYLQIVYYKVFQNGFLLKQIQTKIMKLKILYGT